MIPNLSSRAQRTLLSALLIGTVTACGGGGGGGGGDTTPAIPSQPAASELSLTTSSSELPVGGAAAVLTAILNGSGSVSWQLASGSPGSLSAASGASVSYTPPAAGSLVADTSVTINATSGNLSRSIVLKLVSDGKAPGLYALAGNTASPMLIDGSAAQARFGNIILQAPDAQGNVYLIDGGGPGPAVLRKVSPQGQVSTLNPALSDGDSLGDVWAMSTDAAGNLYMMFVRTGDQLHVLRVRQLAPNGSLRTLVSQSDASVQWTPGRAMAIGSDGTVYIGFEDRVAKLVNGSLTALAGMPGTTGHADGAGSAARFNVVTAMAVNRDGTLAVVDLDGLRQVTADGVVSTLASTASSGNNDGSTATSHLHRPGNVAFDTDGTLLVEDYGDDDYDYLRRVRNNTITTLFRAAVHTNCRGGSSGAGAMRVAPDGTIYAISSYTLSRMSRDGVRTIVVGIDDDSIAALDGTGSAARFCHPFRLTADQGGNVYVLEGWSEGQLHRPTAITVRKVTPSGAVTTLAAVDRTLGTPTGIVITPAGKLMISVDKAIYQVNDDHTLTLFFRPQTPTTFIYTPYLYRSDADSNLYLFEQGEMADHMQNNKWYKITPQGAITILPGDPLVDKALDASGNRYIASGSFIYSNGKAIAGVNGKDGNILGALPGGLDAPQDIIATGPYTFVVASGSALLRLVVPH